MSNRKQWQEVIGLMLVVASLAGCGGAQVELTPTPSPPTATPTPIPPTPTSTPLPTPTPSSGVLRGKLIGAVSQKPLVGAALILCLVGAERKCTLQADLIATTEDDGDFELTDVPPSSYAVFYDPSGNAKAGWKEMDGLEISLKFEGVAMFSPSPERTEFFSTFGGGESIGMTPQTSINFDAEGNATGEGSLISNKYGLTLQFHDGQPLTIQVQRGETTGLEIMAWGL